MERLADKIQNNLYTSPAFFQGPTSYVTSMSLQDTMVAISVELQRQLIYSQ